MIRELCQGGDRTEESVAEEAQLTVARKEVLAHFVVRPEGLPQALEEAALLLGSPLGPLVISAVPARRARGEVSGERLLPVGRAVDADFADEQALLWALRER